jgi:hypothetical protein
LHSQKGRDDTLFNKTPVVVYPASKPAKSKAKKQKKSKVQEVVESGI